MKTILAALPEEEQRPGSDGVLDEALKRAAGSNSAEIVELLLARGCTNFYEAYAAAARCGSQPCTLSLVGLGFLLCEWVI